MPFLTFILLFLSLGSYSREELSITREKCRQQELPACEKLGAHYLALGEWESAHLIGQALCEKDSEKGCLFAGSALLGQGKIKEATHFLNGGCDRFEPLACRSMGRLMLKGEEKLLAHMYFKRACHFGLPQICTDMKQRKTNFSPAAQDLLKEVGKDCSETQAEACHRHLLTVKACALPLTQIDCQLLAGQLSIYFRAKLIQSEAKLLLFALYDYQKSLKQGKSESYSYDLEKVLKEMKPLPKYNYVIGFMKACGKKYVGSRASTNSQEVFSKAYPGLSQRSRANIKVFFSKGTADECYDQKSGYEAYAVASLDPLDPTKLDIWKIDQDKRLENISDGMPLQ